MNYAIFHFDFSALIVIGYACTCNYRVYVESDFLRVSILIFKGMSVLRTTVLTTVCSGMKALTARHCRVFSA